MVSSAAGAPAVMISVPAAVSPSRDSVANADTRVPPTDSMLSARRGSLPAASSRTPMVLPGGTTTWPPEGSGISPTEP